MYDDDKPNLNLELAKQMMEQQLYEEALSILEKGLKENPSNKDFLWLKAKILFITGKFNETIETLSSLILLEKSNAKAYELMGETYRCLNNLEVAEEYYQKALELDSNSFVSWLGKGKIAYHKGEFQTAILCFKTFVQENVERSDIWHLLAKAYKSVNNELEAIDSYNMAIDFDPLNKELYEELGDIYFELGHKDIAKEKYLQALQVEEKTRDINISLYLKVIKILLEENQNLRAFNLCNEILVFQKNNVDALFLSGVALIQMGNIPEGKKRVEEAYSIEKRDDIWDYLNSLEKEIYFNR
ncbi:MAG: tetratricopeptide repeat protein [Candidatus Heimdallarchaeaceae archaeon]